MKPIETRTCKKQDRSSWIAVRTGCR